MDRHRVIKMDRNGTIIKSIGEKGSNSGQFNLPMEWHPTEQRERNIMYVIHTTTEYKFLMKI